MPEALISDNQGKVRIFITSLTATIARRIERIVILPLHGRNQAVKTIGEAVDLIESYNEKESPTSFERYEIQIRFSNGNEIKGQFNDKASAIEFLQMY